MDRKKGYRKWARKHPGRCRKCGTSYIPDGRSSSRDQEGEVAEMQFCEWCALRCPYCLEWLPVIRAQVQSWFNYYLVRNDQTEKFYPYYDKCQEEKVLNVQCPHCSQDLDHSLLGF